MKAKLASPRWAGQFGQNKRKGSVVKSKCKGVKAVGSGAISVVNTSTTDVVKWRNGFKVPVFKCMQNGNVIYACVMDADRLKSITFTEVMRPGNEEVGRQRPLDTNHGNVLKRQMEEGGIFADTITCSPMHGAEVSEEGGRMWLFVPSWDGKFLHADNGQHRTWASDKAIREKSVNGWQFFVVLIPFETLAEAIAIRSGMNSNHKSEDKAVHSYSAHRVGKGGTAEALAAGALVMRAHHDPHSQLRDRIHYLFEQAKSNIGQRMPYNQAVDDAKNMWNVPEFVALNEDQKYQVFHRAFHTWASLTNFAWQDQNAYANSQQAGLFGFMMAMPWIFRKAIEMYGSLTLESVDEAVLKASDKITSGGKDFKPFLYSNFGSGYPHRNAFKRMVVNSLSIALGHDENGQKRTLRMLPPKPGAKKTDYERIFRECKAAVEKAKKDAKAAKEAARVAARVAAKTSKAPRMVHELVYDAVAAV